MSPSRVHFYKSVIAHQESWQVTIAGGVITHAEIAEQVCEIMFQLFKKSERERRDPADSR